MNEYPQSKSMRPEVRATLLQIDLTDGSYKTLTEFAGKIATFLEDSKIQAEPNAVGVLDDLLGAVYSLILARHHFFDDRTDRPIEIPVIQKRSSDVHNGDIRIDGKWIAGWHFNSALFRIAAVYHRLLKVVVGNPTTKEYVPALLPKVRALHDWSNDRAHAIHDEVNTLKHTPQGVHSLRTATFEDGLVSIGELLDLIEEWSQSEVSKNPQKIHP